MKDVTYNAAAYVSGRPGYPEAAVASLVESLGVESTSKVLDLAAGTGKFTSELVLVAGEVVAVEPEPSMRRELVRRLPGVHVRDGHATSIPLGDGEVDAVTVAQAFHWFCGTEALAEIARVLRPRGRLGLIWNVRDLSTPVQQALERIFVGYRGGSPTYRTSAWRGAFTEDAPFGPLHTDEFSQSQAVDQAGLTALALSMSYMSRLGTDERLEVEEAVAAIFAEHSSSGTWPVVEVQYRTNVFWAESRSLP